MGICNLLTARKALFIYLLFFVNIFAFANPQKITFQSKIYNPDGTALEAPSVQFKFSLMNPLGTCVIFSETFTGIDLSGSGGSVVLNLGNGTRDYPVAGGMVWQDAFNNLTASYTCQSVGTFSPTMADSRRIVMQFNDGGANGWQTLPAMDINTVPYAMFAFDSEQLAGHPVTDFVLVSALPGGGTTAASSTTSGYLSSADWTRFDAGGTITSGDITTALGYTPASGTATSADITTALGYAPANSSDLTNYLPLAGGTLSGSLVVSGDITTNSKIGIGAAVPLAPLHILNDIPGNPSGQVGLIVSSTSDGLVPGSGPYIQFDNGSGNVEVGRISSISEGLGEVGLGFSTHTGGSSTEKFRISSTGNVGIGTTTPIAKLDVVGAIAFEESPTNLSVLNHDGGGAYIEHAGSTPAKSNFRIQTSKNGDNVNYSQFGVDPFNGFAFVSIGSGNSNAGFGTTSPAYAVDVVGDVNVTGNYKVNGVNIGTGTVGSVSGTSPISVATGTTTPVISISQSSGTTDGYLSSGDWTTFNNKLANFSTMASSDVTTALGYTPANSADSTNYVAKSGSTMTGTLNLPSNGLTVGTTQLVVSGGNVGIGLASPTARLEVFGPNGSGGLRVSGSDPGFATGNSAAFMDYDATGGLARFGQIKGLANTTGNVAIYASNTEKMRITASGDVGIGTTTPGYKLDVAGDVNITGNFKVNGTNINSGTVSSVSGTSPIGVATGTSTPVISISQSSGTTDGYLSSSDWTTFNNKLANFSTMVSSDVTTALGYTPANAASSGDFKADGSIPMTGNLLATDGTAAAPSLSFSADSTMGMYRAGSGNLGIGTAGSSRLIINSTGLSLQGGGYLLTGAGSAGNPSHTFVSDANTGMFNPAADEIGFATNSTEKVRISSSGNVGIGTTSASAKLQVSSSNVNSAEMRLDGSGYSGANNTYLNFYLDNSAAAAVNYGGIYEYNADRTAGAEMGQMRFYNMESGAIAERMTILGSKVGIGTITPAYTLQVSGDLSISGNYKVNGVNIGSGTVSSVSGTSPISVATGTTTPVISIAKADASTNGYLSSGDWTTFNNKLSNFSTMTSADVTTALTYTPVNKAGDTTTGLLNIETSLSGAAGTEYGLKILPTLTQSGSAGYTALFVNATQTSVGSGTRYLMDLQAGGFSKFYVNSSGDASMVGALALTGGIAGQSYIQGASLTATTSSASAYSTNVTTPSPVAGSRLSITNTSAGDLNYAITKFSVKNTASNTQEAYIAAVSNTGSGSYTPNLVFGQQTSSSSFVERMRMNASGDLGIATTSPTAKLTIASSDGTASSAPLKLIAGTNLTTPEAGAIEYDGTNLYYTDSGATRRTIASTGTSGSLVSVNSGTAGAPSISFSSDTTTGLYLQGAGSLGVSVAGSNIFNFSSAGLVSSTAGGASVSTANGTAGAPTFSFAGDTDTGWFRPAADTMAAATGGTERIRITASGDVGIGTSSPSYKLDVQSTSATDTLGSQIYGTGSGLTYLDVVGINNADTSGAIIRLISKNVADIASAPVNIVKYNLGGFVIDNTETNSAAYTSFNLAGSERMRISSSGDVGIGTTTPGSFLNNAGSQVTAKLLDISPGTAQPGGVIVGTAGRAGLGTTYRQGYFLRRNDSWNSYPTGMWKGSDTTGAEYWEHLIFNNSGGDPSMIFMQNTTEVMRIHSNGYLGIGTTSPSYPLQVSGDSSISGNLAVGVAAPLNRLTVESPIIGKSISVTDSQIYARGSDNGYGVAIGALNSPAGGYIQSMLNDAPSSALPLFLNPSGGAVTVGTTSAFSTEKLAIMNTSAGASAIGINLINNSSTSATAISLDFTPNVNVPLARINAYRTDTGGGGTTDFIFSNYNGSTAVLTETMRIKGDTGNVGIGSPAPGASLDVTGNVLVSGPITTTGGSASSITVGSMSDYHAGLRVSSTNNIWNFGTSPAASDKMIIAHHNGTSWSDYIAVVASGDVGIGTSSPATKLDVNGTLRVLASIEVAAASADGSTAYSIPDISKNIRRITLTNNTTITLPDASSLPSDATYTLTIRLTQDATGSRTVTWAGGSGQTIKWDTNTTPTIASGASQATILQFTIIGGETVWYSSMVWKEQ